MDLLIIAVVLSLDAFSVALSIGLINSNYKKHFIFAVLVGLFHFLMPSLGNITSIIVLKNIIVNGNRLLGFILLILAIQMLFDLKSKKEITIKLNLLILALSVSIDSYFTGVGLGSIEGINLSKYLVFSITSFMFSLIGCKLGVVGAKKYDKIANWAAIIILFLLSVKYIFL